MKTTLLFLLFTSVLHAQYQPEKIMVVPYDKPESVSRMLAEGWTVKKMAVVPNEQTSLMAHVVFVLTPPTHQVETMIAAAKALAYTKAREEYLKKLPQPEKAK